MAQTILTPKTLWEDFNDTLPLKESIVKSLSLNGIDIKHIYFSGREVGGERVRIYGIYAKNLMESKGSILILPDVYSTIDTELIVKYASLGYEVLSVDLGGKSIDKEESQKDYTSYPDVVSYANIENSYESMYFVHTTAKNTAWYEWAAVGRYAINYLKEKNHNNKIGVLGIKYSSNIAFMLSATDSRISASCNLFGAGWLAYKGISKHSNEEIEMNEERYRFLAGIDVQAYSQFITCPVMFLSSTNNGEFDFERSIDTLSRISNQEDLRYNFVTYSKDVLDYHCFINTTLFFDKHLANGKVEFPLQPQLQAENVDGEIVYEIIVDDYKNVKNVHLLCANYTENSLERVWFRATEKENNQEKIIFSRPNFENYNYDIAFAVVSYKNGVTISSKLSYNKFDTKNQVKLPKIIFSSHNLITGFIAEDIKDDDLIGGIFADEKIYHLQKGPCELPGLFTNNTLTSYRLKQLQNDLKLSSTLKFDVYSAVFTVLKLSITDCDGNTYFYEKKINQNKFWQNIMVGLSEFKTKDGLPIENPNNLLFISITSVGEFAINNFLLL